MGDVRGTPDLLTAIAEEAAGRGPSVPDLLAQQEGSAAALIHGEEILTFAQLEGRARRVAGGLAALGVGEGDRVAVWLPNVPAYLELFLACCHLGAICVAVNTRFRSVEVADIVGRTGSKVLAFWPGFKGIDFQGILQAVDPAALQHLESVIALEGTEGAAPVAGARIHGYDWLAAQPPLAESRARPESPCKIFTTSGTTSGPKFVLHNQATIARHGQDVARAFGYDAEDAVILQAVPFCGVFGFAQIWGALAGGSPSVLLPVFDAAETAALIRRHRVTHTNGSDDMLDRLLAAGEGARPYPGLRLFGYARFNPALDDVVERAEAAGLTAVGVYGMSECMALFSFQPPGADAGRRKQGGGIPCAPQAEIRVRDRGTGRLLAPGENGELEIRAPSVMIGYYANPEASRATFTEDRFLKTGDLCSLTEDGGFYFLNRMGDALRLGNFLVNPQEIEAHILTHPAVEGCQVVGVTDGSGAGAKARAVAFVTLRPGKALREAELIAHCEGRLARFKVPFRCFVVEAFPITQSANGMKIQRGKLRQQAQAEVDRMAEERS